MKNWLCWCLPWLLLAAAGCSSRPDDRPRVRVGSKAFTGSAVLGELATLLADSAGARAEHHDRLGDTSKVWEGLLAGALDAYVEYTGTLTREVLAKENLRTDADLDRALARRGLRMSRSLGFSDNYALGMKEKRAAALGIRTISDLRDNPELKIGLSHALIERADGWRGLKRHYDLPFRTPDGIDHALAYQGLERGTLDVIDCYTTDAEIRRYGVRLLDDNRRYFPNYEAVLLYRADLADRAPEALKAMLRLEGAVTADAMQDMNARAVIDKVPETRVAADFLADRLGVDLDVTVETRGYRLLRATVQHLQMVSVSLLLAILTAVPLGILAAGRPWLGQGILGAVGVAQTFPSLALLSVLIVVLSWLHLPAIGVLPATVALYVYSLLPIVRNTHAGLHDIPLQVRESAEALGLSPGARLWLVELPMASRSILAGIKTAAVINVGFATLGGLIGAGGYGKAIISGLDKNDYTLVLEGAIPAVLLALLVQGLFELAERWLVPRGLRLRPAE
jgi:osmoprotectant transport system permease protein